MSIIIPAAADAEAEAAHRPYRMTYETYARIGELGLIRREDRVVLLDGILVQAMTKGPRHHNAVDRGGEVLRASSPAGWSVRSEAPILLGEGPSGVSVPEPDLVVVRGTRDRFEDRHPEAHEVGLVVEVASTRQALLADLSGLARYAYAGIPAAWVVCLADRTVRCYSGPSGPTESPGYAESSVVGQGGLLDLSLGGEGGARLGPIAASTFFAPEA